MKQKILKRIIECMVLIYGLILFAPYSLFSQVIANPGTSINPNIFSPSPNSAGLGNYGNYSVDFFTGQPNISFNLYNIEVDNIKIPINLKYNLASVKPDEHPGWVGLGWNLLPGGSITRLVSGAADEVLISNFPVGMSENIFSYYDNFNTLGTGDWASDEKLWDYYGCMTSVYQNFTDICARPSPDEFVFSFGNFSGSFFLDHNGNWVVKSNEKIDFKIESTFAYNKTIKDVIYANEPYNSYPFFIKRFFYGFQIIDDDGTKYIFGNEPYSIEFSGGPNTGEDAYHSNIMAKTWYLTRIILPNGKEIQLEYKSRSLVPSSPEPDCYYYKPVFVLSFQDQFENFTINYNNNFNYPSSVKTLERQYNVRLNKIITPESEIKFNVGQSNELDFNIASGNYEQYCMYDYGNNCTGMSGGYFSQYVNQSEKHWDKLESIEIFNRINTSPIKKIFFNYYENSIKRLRLNNIKEINITNSEENKYSFEYNTDIFPEYASGKIDHWGYFNDKIFGGPYNKDGYKSNSYYISRSQDFDKMKSGVLSKIIFPTKGYTEFEYQPHDFSKVVNIAYSLDGQLSLIDANSPNESAGGLRIYKTRSFPDPTNSNLKIEKEYIYDKNYLDVNYSTGDISSGVLAYRPKYYIEYDFFGGNTMFKFQSTPIKSFSETKGSHITYSNVIEKLDNGSSTEYIFSNHDNGFIDIKPENCMQSFNCQSSLGISQVTLPDALNKMPLNSLKDERGKLLNELFINENKKIVEENRYYYNTNTNRLDNYVRAIEFDESWISPIESSYGVFFHSVFTYTNAKLSAFRIYTYQTYLEKIENYKYDISVTPNTFVKSVKEYVYSNAIGFHQLKEEKQNSSLNTDSEKFIKKYYYSKDTEMSGEPFISDLNNSNMIGIPLRTDTYRGTEKLGEEKTQYAKDAYTSNLLLPKYIWAKKGTDVNAVLEKKITFDLYDDKGNLKQYTTELGQPVSIVWGYNKTLPIAKVEGLAYSSIPATKLNEAISLSNATGTNYVEANLLAKLDELRAETALDNSFITTYTYKPLIGISTVKDPKGDKLTYTYDFFNRLEFVKDLNGKIVNQYEYHYKN